MYIYIHETLITKMLEWIPNGPTKANILVNYGPTMLFQETVGEWLIKLVFKYNYDFNNYYVGDHEKNNMIW